MNFGLVHLFGLLTIALAALVLSTFAPLHVDETLPAAVGGAALVAALVWSWRNSRAQAAAAARFVAWSDDAGPEDHDPPALPKPLDRVASAALERAERLLRDASTLGAQARRARMELRTLQQDHRLLEQLVAELGDGVIVFDAACKPVLANRAARSFVGLGADDALPESVEALACAGALRDGLIAALRTTSADSRRTRDIVAGDETERRVLRVSFQEVKGDGEGETALAVVLRNVTREVELNKMKSEFASSVSHELKTPLTSMSAILEMLLDGDIRGEDAVRQNLQKVKDETDRLATLVKNLLNLARLEAGVTKMMREPVAIGDVLEHLRDTVLPLATARSQTIVFELSTYLPTVTGDKHMLEQACMNLVSNAIKYTPEGGMVRVKAQPVGKDVEISVKDTGVGIPAKALDLVFQKFTRVENHAGLKATGTGLGLPLAKFVAEAHGGGISVTSEVGKGSDFRLRLPGRFGQDSGEAKLVGLEGIGA